MTPLDALAPQPTREQLLALGRQRRRIAENERRWRESWEARMRLVLRVAGFNDDAGAVAGLRSFSP